MSTHNVPFSIIRKKICLNYRKAAAMGFFPKGLMNEFEAAVVNEPSVFEPLKVDCMLKLLFTIDRLKPLKSLLPVDCL